MQKLHAHFKTKLGTKKHVIWDWNGTLLDDVALCVSVTSEILAECGLPKVTADDHLQKFRHPLVDYYRDLGFDFSRVPFAELSDRFHDRYGERLEEARLFAGSRELLVTTGIGCSILSAAPESDLKRLLLKYGIAGYFEYVYGLGDRLAHSKIERGLQLLQVLDLPPQDIVLVGDTDHDREVAEALGVDALLLEGGHQHPERLRACHHEVLARW